MQDATGLDLAVRDVAKRVDGIGVGDPVEVSHEGDVAAVGRRLDFFFERFGELSGGVKRRVEDDNNGHWASPSIEKADNERPTVVRQLRSGCYFSLVDWIVVPQEVFNEKPVDLLDVRIRFHFIHQLAELKRLAFPLCSELLERDSVHSRIHALQFRRNRVEFLLELPH